SYGPAVGAHPGLAVLAAAAHLAGPVLHFAPHAGEFAGEVHGGAGDGLAAAAVAEEGALGEALLLAGLAHLGDGGLDVAGALLGDDDGGLDFGGGPRLLDGGALSDAGRRGGGRDGAGLVHGRYSSWSRFSA